MYDKKARTAVAVRALFAAFSRGADQQSANANIPVLDVCSVICCFSALFLRKSPAESIALCGIFNILLIFFFGGRSMPETYSYRVPAPSTMAS